jgi:hypothetical protein
MNRQSRIPRSRGGICGVLLILLGLWGGLAPLVGPYFHFGFTPDKVWVYNSGRLYYSVIPGAAALIGGLLVVGTRNRGVGVFGGLLAALGGAWFIAGGGVVTNVLKKAISAGGPIVTASSGAQPLALRSYLESIALLSGLGIVILFVGAVAVGRFSMVSARDVTAADADTYYGDYPAAQASQPDLSAYSTVAGQSASAIDPFPATTGQFPAPAGQTTTPAGQFTPTDELAPAQFPDTTTAPFSPPESPS